MLTLSREELREITGYVRVADQVRWLNRNHWIFVVNAAGRPIVLRSYVEQRLGGGVAAEQLAEPRFENLK